ncbi:hypothetical protein K450DRAFT_259253 [Umbelopsis ramanniana AG]|uniref:EngB-type G domain-containing protein n=1 Tax=Umbelopsis ramanniana AG TaxID=1314678 RepID=A0AAD5E207_UMBRA|nr:uncharacterized protein K450DRAFT_259253 [Umbelopsis ramanniana AG]KAI8575976.1 hypothetical protein K450DRAFT_259253 [Umbelopsis ramanniana AG]
MSTAWNGRLWKPILRWQNTPTVWKRTMATAVKSTPELSNRQKFNQLQPSPSIFSKLEKLGFGELRRTGRYAALCKVVSKNKDQKQTLEPNYKFPLLQFFAGAMIPTSIPEETVPEVAFVGRSNVGKSSLINALAESSTVRTSDKPGLTQQLNFYSVGRLFTIVDMPGYGFAFVDEDKRRLWRELMETYMTKRSTLKMVYVTIDARHGLKVGDKDFLAMLDKNRVPFQVVLTKCDLIILPTLARRYMMLLSDVNNYRHARKEVALVSSRTQSGVNQLRKEILRTVGNLRSEKYYVEKTERQKAKQEDRRK